MPKRYLPMKRRATGFTLLEVLIVVVILGLLAALVVPNLNRHGVDARLSLARSLVAHGGTLASQLELYKLHMGTYPESLQELIEVPEDPELQKKYGPEPYIKEASSLKDPWGQDLQYKWPGEGCSDRFDLYSFGPDMKEGGGDDIGNWPAESVR